MFELEDYSSGYHDGFLNKYADSCGPTLDLYISDSLQDMLDIDIRSEIATVVGGSNELASLVNDLPSSFDHAIDTISSINNPHSSSSSAHAHNSLSSSSSSNPYSSHFSSWLGNSAGPSWSSSNDYYADVGACVNPISVMPLISSSLLHKSPKTNLNVNGLQRSANSPPPASPNVNETKSHLTFSPAQMKISAGALRNEQVFTHIPKQIVTISSAVTAGTTAPATLATNSVLQRKNVTAVDSIKKDLGAELRKISTSNGDDAKSSGSTLLNANSLLNGATTNTIKLAPGIGGLTFANSITYNKLKQQSAAKSPQGSPVTANGTIVLKRDRDSSPLHNMATLNANGSSGQLVTKLLGRSVMQAGSNFTPKSIASVHSPLMQNSGSIGSPSSSSSSSHSSPSTSSSGGGFSAGLIPIGVSNAATNPSASTTTITSIAVKPLHQKIKVAPVESEYPKPAYSYSCLIAMALKNSRSGSLPVSEIYSFMCEHFPYFRTAPSGWKNSVRHNLSLNKCFEKIEKPATNGSQRKGCLWAMNPERITKMDEEVQKWSRKDPNAIRNAMVYPEHLEALERGEMKHGSSGDSDVELDSQSEIEETSDLEEHELDDTIVDNMFVEEDIEEDEMLSNGIMVSGSDGMSDAGDGGGANGNGEMVDDDVEVCGMLQQQQHRDFDIEVEDIYDAIDIEDDKDHSVHMSISQPDIIELSPADLNVTGQQSSSGYQSPKRARLNINYSIGPAGELEKQITQHHHHQQQHNQHQQHHHQQQQSIKQYKLQPQQQHIVVQTITNGNSTTSIQTINGIAGNSTSHFQQINAVLPNQNRRKMQLVNRIA